MRIVLGVLLLSGFALQAQNLQIKKVPLQPTLMSSGKEMFRAYCATCHGPGAKGDGPAAAALKKAPADLTQLARKNNGKFPDAYIATKLKNVEEPMHGSKEMPVWGPLLSSVSHGDEGEVQLRITNIVSYLGSIQAK
jgi:mono/diheme cytochrome c family protein